MWINLIFIFSLITAKAAPDHLEIWFLSHAKKADLINRINEGSYYFYPKTAELQCQEMGDLCFDPQFGLYKKGSEDSIIEARDIDSQSMITVPHATSVDRNMIDCDPTNRFDIFCGKAKSTKVKNTKFEIWIDTSSSMREVDYMLNDGGCSRKRLISQLDKTCPFNEKVSVMMFDTSIKEAGSMDSLCINQGLNDYKRLMDWIKRSTAKTLIVITDIYEFHKEFSDFVEENNGIFRGDKDPLTSQDLNGYVDHLAKLCK